MADKLITQFPPAPGTIDPDDEIPITGLDGGTTGLTYRRKISDLAALFEPPTPPGGSGLGNGGWELHQSWVQSVDGNLSTSMDILGLAGVSDVRIVIDNVTKSSAAEFTMQASQNNGSSWFTTSGNYISFSTGASANRSDFPLPGGSTTAARSNASVLLGLESRPSFITPALNTGQPSAMFVANGNAINALRILFGAGALNGGAIYIYKRRLPRYRMPIYTLAEANALSGIQDGEVVIISDASSPVKGSAISDGGSTPTGAFRLSGSWVAI